MPAEIRAVCPSCQSITLKGRVDEKFYVNSETGLGYCFHCGFKGKFTEGMMDELNVVDIRTKAAFDPQVYKDLESCTGSSKAYLARRFPDADLEPFGLRYSPSQHAIAIPTFNPETKEIQGIKYRLIAPLNDQRYLAETGSQFGGYWLEGKKDKLLIVEGEFDAICAKLCHFPGTVLALQTNKLSQQSINLIRQFKHLFLALDNDKAGAEGTELIKSIVGMSEVNQVQMPEGIKDLNEYLTTNGAESTRLFLREQTKTELDKATVGLEESIDQLVTFLSDERNTRGDTTGYRSIDQLLGGGLRPNELTLVVAFAKAGKTSFLNNLVHNLASTNKRVAIASFEMDPARTLFPSLLSIAGQTNIRKINDRELLQESVDLISRECSYLNNIITLRRFGYTPWSEVEEWATMMKEQHQIEYLVLDHSGFMTAKMTDAEENQILAKNIKKLTLTLGIHIICVVQAPKTKDGLSIQTAYGGMAWSQNCDSFFILERDREDETLLKVRLEAARYPGSNPSHIPAHLFYDRETGTLVE